MDDAERRAVVRKRVGVVEGAQQLGSHVGDHRRRQRPAPRAQATQQRLQVLALDQLQGHVIGAVGLPEVDDLDDGGAAQVGREPRLVEEQLHGRGHGQLLRQHALETHAL
jgi:hypothetical protein